MKSYLGLVPISAKIHRRRNRMTLLCIIIAVFLVVSLFSMIDMFIQNEKANMLNKHGNWHIRLLHVSEAQAEQIGSRKDTALMAWRSVVNDDRSEDYRIDGKMAVLYGVDKAYMTDVINGLEEGAFPENSREVILSSNAKGILGISLGETIRVDTSFGSVDYTVCGFGTEDAAFDRLYDVFGIYMDQEAFYDFCGQAGKDVEPSFYIRFKNKTVIRKSIADIKEQYGLTDENIDENTAVLGLTGDSSNDYVKSLYLPGAVLSAVIMAAGVMMISGSMNSNIAERSQFFGMLRCIGASKQQILHIVRLEALNWCITAIPAGVLLGTAATWGLCAVLRSIRGSFAGLPLFGVSTLGIIIGVAVGFATVILAAHSPAKRAARVSPMEAVSGSAVNITRVRREMNLKFLGIEISLGIHHATASRKNLFFMTCSFALSIVLFLSFSAGLDFAKVLLPSLRPWQPDFAITCEDGSNSVDRSLAGVISEQPGVKRVFGNMAAIDVPAVSDRGIDKVTFVSYDTYLLDCAGENLIEGNLSEITGDSSCVLTIYNRNNPLEVGDEVQLYGDTLQVTGVLSDGLFADDVTIICSEETFMRLTKEKGYGILSVQFAENASDEDLNGIRSLIGSKYLLSDYRKDNLSSVAEYWATRVLVYCFLGIVAMITVLNIVNSTSMSVSARIRQYGIMRALGMEERQFTKMLAAEVFTFALFGSLVGCVLGLLLHRLLYIRLITAYFGEPWRVPVILLVVILCIVFISAIAAIHGPAKRIRNMAITDTINEL